MAEVEFWEEDGIEGRLANIHEAILPVHWAFERLAEAYADLSNAMSDLISWHPQYDSETGRIEDDDE